MAEPIKKWAAKYENQSGSPNQPQKETVVLDQDYPDNKSAFEAAMQRERPFVDAVLVKVERIR